MLQQSARRWAAVTAVLSAIAIAIAIAIAQHGVPDALAEQPAGEVVAEALDTVAPEVLENAVSDVVTGRGGDPTVQVPTSVTEPITITSTTQGVEVDLTLPSPTGVDAAHEISDGVVSFDNGDGSFTAPVTKADGSVQVATVITSVEAPTRYKYEFSVSGASQIAVEEGGMVIARDADGEYLAGVLPAWARDADGSPIATHYEVIGDELTQVVEHRAATTMYPVVADPWAGIDLFQSTHYNRVGTYLSRTTTSGLMSLYAQGGYYNPLSTALWAEIMRTAGWSELATKRPLGITTGTRYPSIRQQYDCHVVMAEQFGFPALIGIWSMLDPTSQAGLTLPSVIAATGSRRGEFSD